MDSACILAVLIARTFSFETFWAKAGDTSSALTRNPVDRLTILFKVNQLMGYHGLATCYPVKSRQRKVCSFRTNEGALNFTNASDQQH